MILFDRRLLVRLVSTSLSTHRSMTPSTLLFLSLSPPLFILSLVCLLFLPFDCFSIYSSSLWLSSLSVSLPLSPPSSSSSSSLLSLSSLLSSSSSSSSSSSLSPDFFFLERAEEEDFSDKRFTLWVTANFERELEPDPEANLDFKFILEFKIPLLWISEFSFVLSIISYLFIIPAPV